ncbi:MAG: MarR family transcriptional regulator [Alphaproteobacteria bacterium]|nr:MAG: MarR family transcriptional regulator [Alphaproteobacteria bacterium]
MDSNFAFEVADTARLMRRAFDRRAAELGVTRAQWRVLSRLARQDGQKQVDLADALDVEPITLCRMIDRLEEAGLVERRPAAFDRRAWQIHLTAKARPINEKLSAVAEGFLEDVLEGVSDEEVRQVREILERVRANIAGADEAGRRSL